MSWLTVVFVLLILGGAAIELWLSRRQEATVARLRGEVPAPFVDSISGAEHAKAADYTIAKVRFGRVGTVLDLAVTLVLTLGGGIAALDALWRHTGLAQPWLGVAVIGSCVLGMQLVALPLSVWRTFVLEARFGFNRTTPMLFIADLGKGLALAVLLGGPLLVATRLAFMLLMAWAWPAFIAPLFNRFSPLTDTALKARIEALLARCGFTSKGVFVVDNSRRSSHGNAYFTGIGRNKRIVFFDTLLERLSYAEVEAVLAHELGHFKLRHVRARLLLSIALSLAGLAVLGWLKEQPGFYAALGVPTASTHAALLLFALAVPAFTFFLTPLSSLWSRRHEFEADAFATRTASATQLASALVKLQRDNAGTLTPDPVYAAFYYSHPAPLARIARLQT
jgi:STE24 endopeptidase